MCSDPSRPMCSVFSYFSAEKRVTAIPIGNRLITVSIQTHPVCLSKRQGRENKKEMNIIIYQQRLPIVPCGRKGCNTSLFISIFCKKENNKRCHHSRLILENVTYKSLPKIPFNDAGLCLCCLVIRLLCWYSAETHH